MKTKIFKAKAFKTAISTRNHRCGEKMFAFRCFTLVITFLLLFSFSSFLFPGFLLQEAEALTISVRGQGFYTNFADTNLLQEEEIELYEDELEDTLAFDITSAQVFTLGGGIKPWTGTKITIDAGLFSASDSDRVESAVNPRVDASFFLSSLQIGGEVDLAEFAEMYDIPSLKFYGGLGYYHGLGEISYERVERSDQDLSGGNIGFRAGTGLAFDLGGSFEVQGTIGYRSLEIKFEEHTDLSGLELGGGVTYKF